MMMVMLTVGLVIAVCNVLIVPRTILHYGQRYFAGVGAQSPAFSMTSMTSLLIGAIVVGGLSRSGSLPADTMVRGVGLAMILCGFYGIVLCDLRFRLIPDRFHVLGLLGVLAWHGVGSDMLVRMISAGVLWLGLALLGRCYAFFRGQEPMGLGDVKLLAWVFLLLGTDIVWVMLGACVLGLLLLKGGLKNPESKREDEVLSIESDSAGTIAFAPALIGATLMTWLGSLLLQAI